MLYHIANRELSLPVSGSVVRRLSLLATEDDPDTEAVFALLESEVALGGAVMKLAMSPSYHGHGLPRSVREASTRVGARRALSAANATVQRTNYQFPDPAMATFASHLWLTHRVSSVLAELVAEHTGVPRPDQVNTTALFTRFGELVVLRTIQQLWPQELACGAPSSGAMALVRRCAVDAACALIHRWSLPHAYARFAGAFADPATESDATIRRGAVAARFAASVVADVLELNPFDLDFSLTPTLRAELGTIDPALLANLTRRAAAVAKESLGTP